MKRGGRRFGLRVVFWFLAALSCVALGDPRPYALCDDVYRRLNLTPGQTEPVAPLPESARELTDRVNSALARFRGSAESLPPEVTCPHGGCILTSAALQQALTAVGIQTRRVEVDGNEVIFVGDKKRGVFLYHFFLVIEADGKREEVIIDPSYRQFMPPEVRENFPEVFVGTRSQLIETFRQSQVGMEKDRHRGENYALLSPEQLADFTYRFGAAKRKRILHREYE